MQPDHFPPDPAAADPSQSVIYRPASYLERLAISTMFPRAQPLEVELGAGDGSFLVEWARRNPGRNFLGVERLLGRLRKIERKGRRAGLNNLRGLRIEASYFLQYLMPERSAEALHLYFPDPWPKRKHRKHRLVTSPFSETAARVLVPGGCIFLRTDDPDYFAQMNAVFAANQAFQPSATPEALRAVLTDFERDFQARNVATLHAAYQRR